MTFDSATFFLFAAVIVPLHWCMRSAKTQNRLLLVASYVFYGWWDWRFCFLIAGSSLLDFWIANRISRSFKAKPDGSIARWYLYGSIAANLSLLGVFKYFDFFADSFAAAASTIGLHPRQTTLNLILPVGISFYTFQTLSYTIDVYRKRISASQQIVPYLAFVSFFPQLVAGPIERASALLPQFNRTRRFDSELARSGLRLILWGLFKKLVIADQLAVVVDQIYDDPTAHGGPILFFATVCFAFQIYGDFSGYSDVAIGTARLLGIRLMRNFNYPYFSQSIGEFWQRWHISLSTWFRDYVYIPLGGSHCSSFRHRCNLLATFLVSGLWHGAAWNFVAWGGINGVAIAGWSPSGHRKKSNSDQGSGFSQRKQETGRAIVGGHPDLPRPITLFRIWRTLLVVSLGWVFFRARSLSEAIGIINTIVRDSIDRVQLNSFVSTYQSDRCFETALIASFILVVWEWFQRRRECPLDFLRLPRMVRWTIYSTLIWVMLYTVAGLERAEFIYFRF